MGGAEKLIIGDGQNHQKPFDTDTRGFSRINTDDRNLIIFFRRKVAAISAQNLYLWTSVMIREHQYRKVFEISHL